MTYFSSKRRGAAALVVSGLLSSVLLPAAADATPVYDPDTAIVFGMQYGQGVHITTVSTAGVATEIPAPASDAWYGGTAVDAHGNYYLGTTTAVYEVAAGSTTPVAVATGLSGTGYMSLDPAGNLYVGTFNGGGVTRIAAGSHAVTTLDPQHPYSGLANDAAGDLYAIQYDINTTSSSLVEFANGATTPTTLATGSGYWGGLAVGPDGTIYLSDSSNSVVRHFTASGTTLPDVLSGVSSSGLGVDPAGNLYTLTSSGVDEYRAGSTTARPIAGASQTGYPTMLSVVPAWSTATTSTTTPTTPTVTPNVAKPAITAAKAAARSHRLRVRIAHLRAGEAYQIKLGKRVLKRGVASQTGSVSTRVRLPRCVGGRHRITVVGATSGRLVKRFSVKRIYPTRCTNLF